MSKLQAINTPQDLKPLTVGELNGLAGEIRQYLLNSVSSHGGHLAANLGVVELTLALHYVFDCPRDKLIWDVGHQSYVHKILTGRRDQMDTLRQFRGLSGFPRREESPYDCFGVGHSSTSISAALGMVMARDLSRQDYAVTAVIGDGALTGGMAFEALNHAGHSGKKITVVLNDNAMSIAPNVGAMAMYLNRLRSAPRYHRTKEKIEEQLNRIPNIGPNLARGVEKIKDTLRYLMVPGTLFEELGFTYIGPVDGHDLEALVPVFQNVRALAGPVLAHVVTQKGCGYQPAVGRPDIFHGVGPFDLETGAVLQKGQAQYTDVFGDTLVELAHDDDRIVAFTAAMARGTGLTKFSRLFPERFFDVGICEQHAVTMAAGMAGAGYRPVVCIYSTFLQRAYDQIVHDVALQQLPVIFAVDRAGLVGEDGPTHHGVFDLSFLSCIPNLTILSPSSTGELQVMLRQTLSTAAGPVIIRYPKADAVDGGEARIDPPLSLRVKGQRIALLAVGRMLFPAEETGALLRDRYGLFPSVAHVAQVKPLPEHEILQLAAGHDYLVTLEEGSVKGGIGSGVLEIVSDHDLAVKVLRLGIPDQFVPHGAVSDLLALLELTPPQIAERIIARWPHLLPDQRVSSV
jgi:1-deoxy-D-xylulose-5-phosphate synthase